MPGLVRGKLQNGGVVQEPEEWNFIGNQVERIHQVGDGRDDGEKHAGQNGVITALVSPQQTQHGMQVGPGFLEWLSREGRRLARGLPEQLLEPLRIERVRLGLENRFAKGPAPHRDVAD